MRILVVGAGETGCHVIKQLKKNPKTKVITLDPRDEPEAVRLGIVSSIDIKEALTPLTLEYVLKKTRPDLILLTTETQDLGIGHAPGVSLLNRSLREELSAIAEVPVINVAPAGKKGY